MSRLDTESWLAELQGRFSSVLRSPLSAAGGMLHADPLKYPARTLEDFVPGPRLSAAQRLSVYQRQYWMRLLQLLQEQYPLVTRLCGAWGFNQWAIAFLSARPPRGADLAFAVEGFDVFLAEHLDGDRVRAAGAPALPRTALLEAARWDTAFRRVFTAPEEAPFRLDASVVATLPVRRLRFSSAFARVTEHWPLLELRSRIVRSSEAGPVALPPRYAQPRQWALYRSPLGLSHRVLEVDEARLLELLEEQSVGDALALLETECDPARCARLPERTQRYLARAVEQGFFSGIA